MIPKFRAWLKDENRMLDVRTMEWLSDGSLILWVGGEIGKPIYARKVGIDCDLMQSTGFQYNDGKDIFEGDIVRLGYGIPPTSADLVIEWTTTETIDDVPVCGWWMRNLDPKGTSSMMSDLYDLEKIGNRYANPELLRAEEMEGKR